MATSDGFNRKEFRNQMEELEHWFEGLDQSKETKGQVTGQKFLEKDKTLFKHKRKHIVTMSGKQGHEIPMLAYIAS